MPDPVFETTLKEAIAAALNTAGVATWRATGAYEPGEVGIFMNVLPTMPSTAIVITDYAVDDDVSGRDDVIGIQFKYRGAPDVKAGDAIKDGIFRLFHARQPGMLGSVKVTQCYRRSGTSLGQDENGRLSGTENYYFTVYRPTDNRI